MKKIITSILLLVYLNSSAQKKDTTVQITCTLEQFRGLVSVIDQNIDSKKTSKEIIDFLFANTKMVPNDDKKEKPKVTSK